MSEEKTGPGQKANDGRTPAEQRGDYLRALEEEKRGYEQRGLKGRLAEVDAEIARLTSEAKPARKSTRG